MLAVQESNTDTNAPDAPQHGGVSSVGGVGGVHGQQGVHGGGGGGPGGVLVECQLLEGFPGPLVSVNKDKVCVGCGCWMGVMGV